MVLDSLRCWKPDDTSADPESPEGVEVYAGPAQEDFLDCVAAERLEVLLTIVSVVRESAPAGSTEVRTATARHNGPTPDAPGCREQLSCCRQG